MTAPFSYPHGPRAACPLVSVVVLSHRRPQLLKRVIQGLGQLTYPQFEIVVVGDQPTIHDYGLPEAWARLIRYDQLVEPNICRARNLAVRLAGGEIIAFCDDDAVPEPDWLDQLILPFQVPAVGAAAGTVRGANGIAVDWAGGHFDRTGAEVALRTPPGVQIVDAETQIATGQFHALMGVNTAFRRSALLAVGGFDESFHYYLDETDMALRLTLAGWSSALVPAAEVHHLHEVNAVRGALRTPRNLYEIAASKAYFCRRHLGAGADALADALARFRRSRIADLDPYLRLGVLRRAGRNALEGQLDAGMADGLQRAPVTPLTADLPRPGFQRFAPPRASRSLQIAMVTGWGLARVGRLRRAAARLAAAGHRVSCFSFLSGPQAPRVTFDDGVWLHSGGTWRPTRGLKGLSRAVRARVELNRVNTRRRALLVLRAGRSNAPGAVVLPRIPGLPPLSAVPQGLPSETFRAAVREITALLSDQTVNVGDLGRRDLSLVLQDEDALDAEPQALAGFTRA